MVDDPRREDRLATLAAYGLLDMPPEAALQTLVRHAADITGAPIAMISLLDANRQVFKGQLGVDDDESDLEGSFCLHAVQSSDTFVVPDAEADPRFRGTTFVAGDPHIRFYAGAPLEMANGVRVGTLCVIDTSAREGLSDEERSALEVLARRTVAAFELRHEIEARGVGSAETGEPAFWLGQAGELLAKASAALDRAGATAPLAALERVIGLVDDLGAEGPATA